MEVNPINHTLMEPFRVAARRSSLPAHRPA
jgi:hypothetical protein